MADHGVTPEGFNRKTLEEIKADIEAELRATIGESLNVSAATPIGQIIGIFATKLSEIWEAVEAAYGNFDPAAASDRALDNLASITGTKRKQATKSAVDCTVALDLGFSAQPGQMVASVEGNPRARFENRDVVTRAGAPFVSAVFVAQEPGPVQALARTLNVIAEPLDGWNSVVNPRDADEGQLYEEDVALRARRAVEVAGGGTDSKEAIRAHVSRIREVKAVIVFENTTLLPSAGLPPKSFEVVISDGSPPQASDTEVAQSIWDSKPVGIEAFGSIAATATDATGQAQLIHFSRVTQVAVWISMTVLVDEAVFQRNEAGIKSAILDYAAREIGIGDDVVVEQLRVPIFSIDGVVDLIQVAAGFSASGTRPENLPIEARKVASFDTSRITVSYG